MEACAGIETERVAIEVGTERIVLIDDEAAILRMLETLLSNLGYKITPFDSSIVALQTFREAPDHFDLVITDMTMPGLTGDKLTVELKKIRSDIPIILCTGFSEKVKENKDSLSGVSKVLMKPILRGELANTVRQVLDHKEPATVPKEVISDMDISVISG
jgi:CheY-like chemotaxis protein